MKIKLKSNVEYEVKWKHMNNTQNINRKMDSNIHYNNSSYTECEIINKNNPYILGIGVAKVGKKEKNFNKEIGRKISLKKALLAIELDKETRAIFWEEYHKLTNKLQRIKWKN